MSIFQKSVVKTYLAGIDKDLLEKAYQIFKKNYSSEKIELIKKLKEEEYQDGFLRDIFVDVLGYTLKPDDNFNLVREFKNQSDGKKADGAILKNDTAKAVIEIKSTKTKDLKSVTEQAFNYKHNQPDCKYVITSNFQKLRFYLDYASEYEEFDLFRIAKQGITKEAAKDAREEFALFFLILSKESILNDLPAKLKKESISHEESVSKRLYTDYSLFRNKLFENLTINNPSVDKLTLFTKSQKLIDRFLFILFAEDKGLLPPNSISRIIQRFNILKEEDSYKPLYEIFKQYFGYMNIGRKGKEKSSIDDIPAYNGGLFYPDDVLYNLKIDDNILIDDLKKLSLYDFDTEIDVNILGHIFEHSLSEIEETTAKIKGIDVDKTKSKRKKDGIFYTPQYITQYIVENTIGKLCEEKRREFEINEIEVDDSFYAKNRKLSKKGNALLQKLEDYKNWLLSLKILDPACGSGAFLNQALNFLINEHKFIIEIQTDLQKGETSLFNIEKVVLENNLYGVDINEESVEITKLSLWLRTAHKERKLSDLSTNIRCGNSLIDDPEIAGDKAFEWEKEFSKVMENGGFDVVIGNPPYVSANNMSFKAREYFNKNLSYKTLKGKWDLYIPFIEKSLNLLKINGFLSFIIPYGFLNQPFGIAIRKHILSSHSLISVADLHDTKIFKTATVPSCIPIIRIGKEKEREKVDIVTLNNENLEFIYSIPIYKYQETKQNMFRTENLLAFENIISKVKTVKNGMSLSDIVYISTGAEIHGKERRDESRNLISGHSKFDVLFDKYKPEFKPYIEGSAIEKSKQGRYSFPQLDYYLDYQTEIMRSPKFPELFDSEKIIIRRSSGLLGIIAIYDTRKIYTSEKCIIIIDKLSLPQENKKYTDNIAINLKYVLCLLNTKLINFYYKSLFSGFIDVYPNNLKQLIIPLLKKSKQHPFIEKADIMLAKNKELQELKADFFNFFKSELKPEKISNRLENWHDLDWDQFKKEMEKCKVRELSLKDRKEWQDYFIEHKEKADKLKSIIETTDREIDFMVYDLYGLTQEEIAIVEGQSATYL